MQVPQAQGVFRLDWKPDPAFRGLAEWMTVATRVKANRLACMQHLCRYLHCLSRGIMQEMVRVSVCKSEIYANRLAYLQGPLQITAGENTSSARYLIRERKTITK